MSDVLLKLKNASRQNAHRQFNAIHKTRRVTLDRASHQVYAAASQSEEAFSCFLEMGISL